MVKNFHIPPTGYGPGSQPLESEDQELEYMPMPSGMRTFEARTPHLEEGDRAGLAPALTALEEIAKACALTAKDGEARRYDLSALDRPNRALIAETMGEGEVGVKIASKPAIMAQESVFAGVWQISSASMDYIEIAAFPSEGYLRAFNAKTPAQGKDAKLNPQVVNAPPLLIEILDKSNSDLAEPHVVNLTLLPHTEADLAYLDEALGLGSVDILSRGYGNCRIRSTAQKHVWRVQYFNSMDTLILDSFEVTNLPEVAMAAREDIEDSASRLVEVLGAIR